MLPCRLTKLGQQLREQNLLPDGADPGQMPREDLLSRRLQHLEGVIEGQVAHICTLRESVQRTAGAQGRWQFADFSRVCLVDWLGPGPLAAGTGFGGLGGYEARWLHGHMLCHAICGGWA